MSVFNSSNGKLPTRTNATKTYIEAMINKDNNIALGKFLGAHIVAAPLLFQAECSNCLNEVLARFCDESNCEVEGRVI